MTISFQLVATGTKTAGAGTGINAVLNSTAGDFILVAISTTSNTSTVTSISDTGLNTYSRVGAVPNGSNLNVELWKSNGVNASGTIVVRVVTGFQGSIAAASYRNVSSVATGVTDTGSVSPITSSSTTIGTGSWLVMAGGKPTSAVYTVQNGNIRAQIAGVSVINTVLMDSNGSSSPVTDSATMTNTTWGMVKAELIPISSITAVSHGAGGSSAIIKGSVSPVGSSHGAGSNTALLRGSGVVLAVSHGIGSSSATIKGAVSPAGSSHSVGSTAALLFGLGAISAVSHGAAAQMSSLKGVGSLISVSHGVGATLANGEGSASLAAVSHSIGTAIALLKGSGKATAIVYGAALSAATLLGAAWLSALVQGAAITTADLVVGFEIFPIYALHVNILTFSTVHAQVQVPFRSLIAVDDLLIDISALVKCHKQIKTSIELPIDIGVLVEYNQFVNVSH